MPAIHQVLSGAGRFDAVTNEALAFRARFERWGFGGTDVAAHSDGLSEVRPLDAFHPAPDDIVLIHYSAYAPRVEHLLELRQRKLLLYHNVTPSRFLWEHDPAIAVQCSLGREQLSRFVAACDSFAADSAFNAGELREAGASDVTVVPILIDVGAVGAPGPPPPPEPPRLLFVGRLMPHKRQDDLIRLLALYRAEHEPDASLTLVGGALNEGYREWLAALADELVPGAVHFEHGLSPAELADRYRAAHAFVCLSEHEGFCIPVLEALHFGVPVVARPRGAVPEVAAEAALYADDADLAVAAELVHLAVTDVELRAELQRRGAERARAFAPERTEAALRAWLSEVEDQPLG